MEGRLAESVSGPVYRARDTSGRIVAIKVLEGPHAAIPNSPIVCARRRTSSTTMFFPFWTCSKTACASAS